MKFNQIFTYSTDTLRYWLVKVIMVFVKLLAKMHVFPTFHKDLIAVYAVSTGADAYNNGQYLKSFSILKPVADYEIESHDVGRCQYMLGILYLNGLGIDKDIDKAKNYLKKAVNQGNDDTYKYLNKIQ